MKKMTKVTYKKLSQYTSVPYDLLVRFLTDLSDPQTTTQKKYDADPESQDLILTQVIKTTKDRPLKDVLDMYKTLYPQYFDQLTYRRASILATDKDKDTDAFLDEVKKAFQ